MERYAQSWQASGGINILSYVGITGGGGRSSNREKIEEWQASRCVEDVKSFAAESLADLLIHIDDNTATLQAWTECIGLTAKAWAGCTESRREAPTGFMMVFESNPSDVGDETTLVIRWCGGTGPIRTLDSATVMSPLRVTGAQCDAEMLSGAVIGIGDTIVRCARLSEEDEIRASMSIRVAAGNAAIDLRAAAVLPAVCGSASGVCCSRGSACHASLSCNAENRCCQDGTASGRWYIDVDADGFGDARTSVVSCGAPAGYVADASDCDDTSRHVNPRAAETCRNDIDDDCRADTLDRAGACAPPPEVCDGADNDFDGQVDEGVTNLCGGCGATPREQCSRVDEDCNGSNNEGNVCNALGPIAWSPWFSEEGAAQALCGGGRVAIGLECSGDYCDSMRLRCAASPFTFTGAVQWSSSFSEEGAGAFQAPPGSVIVGARCSGSYCDNISLAYQAADIALGGCYWSQHTTDGAAPLQAPAGHYLHGMRCSGRYCDNVYAEWCRPI